MLHTELKSQPAEDLALLHHMASTQGPEHYSANWDVAENGIAHGPPEVTGVNGPWDQKVPNPPFEQLDRLASAGFLHRKGHAWESSGHLSRISVSYTLTTQALRALYQSKK